MRSSCCGRNVAGLVCVVVWCAEAKTAGISVQSAHQPPSVHERTINRPEPNQDDKHRQRGASNSIEVLTDGVTLSHAISDSADVSILPTTPNPFLGNVLPQLQSSSSPLPSLASSGDAVETASGLVIPVPVTVVTVAAAVVVLALSILGGLYIRKLINQHKCSCPLCTGAYTIEDKIGAGGFGSVYVVRAKPAKDSALARTGLAMLRWLWPWCPRTSSSTNTPPTREGAAGVGGIARGGAVAGHAAAAVGAGKEKLPAGGKEGGVLPRLRRRTRSSSTDAVSTSSGGGSGGEDEDVAPPRHALLPPALSIVADATYVLKMIQVSDINDATEAQREARDLRFLRHPRIVKYVDDFLHSTAHGATQEGCLYVCIIMERCKVDLRRYIQKMRRKKAPVPEEVIIRWAAQLVSALKYCHARSICHRDVKSQNIFLATAPSSNAHTHSTSMASLAPSSWDTLSPEDGSKDGGDHSKDDVKLGDFGLARTFEKPFTVYTEAGTDCYKSPEAFMGGRRDARKADIWALGLVLIELVSREFTWERPGSLGAQVLHKENGALEKVLALIPELYSSSLRLLIRKCLLPNPDERPSAEELFRFRILRRALAGKSAFSSASFSRLSRTDSPLTSARGGAGALAKHPSTGALHVLGHPPRGTSRHELLTTHSRRPSNAALSTASGTGTGIAAAAGGGGGGALLLSARGRVGSRASRGAFYVPGEAPVVTSDALASGAIGAGSTGSGTATPGTELITAGSAVDAVHTHPGSHATSPAISPHERPTALNERPALDGGEADYSSVSSCHTPSSDSTRGPPSTTDAEGFSPRLGPALHVGASDGDADIELESSDMWQRVEYRRTARKRKQAQVKARELYFK